MKNTLAFLLEPGIVLLAATLSLPVAVKFVGDALVKLGKHADNKIKERKMQHEQVSAAKQSGS